MHYHDKKANTIIPKLIYAFLIHLLTIHLCITWKDSIPSFSLSTVLIDLQYRKFSCINWSSVASPCLSVTNNVSGQLSFICVGNNSLSHKKWGENPDIGWLAFRNMYFFCVITNTFAIILYKHVSTILNFMLTYNCIRTCLKEIEKYLIFLREWHFIYDIHSAAEMSIHLLGNL